MKTVTIEELLSWAFVHELPKGGGTDGLDNANSAWRMLQASSWGKVTSFAELMTLVDTGSDGRGGNFLIEQGEPHEDAVTLGRAVADLALCEIVVPMGWNPLGDWPSDDPRVPVLAAEAVARVVARFQERSLARQLAGVVSLVIGTAILGREPDWSAPMPKLRMVERGGKPAWFVKRTMTDVIGNVHVMEVDGFNARTQRPIREAYRKFEFSDDPAGDILGRLDWQLWIAAMRRLEDVVRRKLTGHRLVALDRSMTPWLDEDRGGVRLVAARLKKSSAAR